MIRLIGTLTWTYTYDAYGVQKNPDPLDGNAFRYAGQYFDTESGTYYLRARYYNPNTGRFTQPDRHWNIFNSLYGDDPLELNGYTVPSIAAVMQSTNLYVYCMGNPVLFIDISGQVITPANIIGALIGAGIGALIGLAISNAFELSGWQKAAAIGGSSLIVGIVGWFAGPFVLEILSQVVSSAIISGQLALSSLSNEIIRALQLERIAINNAITHINEFIVSSKHLMSAGGGYSKFATDSTETINQWIVMGLNNATDFVVNSGDSFYTIVNIGQTIGTKGEECIKIIFSMAGKIISAYPTNK